LNREFAPISPTGVRLKACFQLQLSFCLLLKNKNTTTKGEDDATEKCVF